MDAMTPWLLLIIAALIVGCMSLYFQLRQVESQSLGRQSVIADELGDAEAALLSALEKLRQMDTVLAVRERHLASGEGVPLPERPARAPLDCRGGIEVEGDQCQGTPAAERQQGSVAMRVTPAPPAHDLTVRAGQNSGPWWPSGAAIAPGADASRAASRPWPGRAAALARTGMTARQIAQELELPVGQVELALALEGGESPLDFRTPGG